MSSSAYEKALEIVAALKEAAPDDNPKLRLQIAALEDALKTDGLQREEAERMLREYEQAYEKLTSPANRIGVFLKWLENENALIAIGDTEYVSPVDPSIDAEQFSTGIRVRLNEAYAVVGALEQSASGPIVKVAEALPDGRIQTGSDVPGAEGRFVIRSKDLAEAAISPGDQVRLDPTGRVAVEHFFKSEGRDHFFEEVPQIDWSQVGGQEEAIRLIRETIELPLLHGDVFAKFDKKPVKGILLYGPPGCGKTLIGKAAAYNLAKAYSEQVGHEVKEYFMAISGPRILNMWLGETERMVREIFRIARERAKEGRLVFIFIDEAESVLRTRSSGRWLNISNTVVPQFCAELDGLVSLENVVLILTSNRPDYIDPAILRPERIDRKVKVARPDREAAAKILGIYLHDKIPLDSKLMAKHKCKSERARNALVESAVGYLWRTNRETEFLRIHYRSGQAETLYWKDLVSGALIKSVVDRAKDLAIRRAIHDPSGEHGVSEDDLFRSMEAEYRENEIFPKSDVQDDWLKLIDVEPENVAAVRPVGNESYRRTIKEIL